jgi:hypothetical protein
VDRRRCLPSKDPYEPPTRSDAPISSSMCVVRRQRRNTRGRTPSAAQVMESSKALKIRPTPGVLTDSPDTDAGD